MEYFTWSLICFLWIVSFKWNYWINITYCQISTYYTSKMRKNLKTKIQNGIIFAITSQVNVNIRLRNLRKVSIKISHYINARYYFDTNKNNKHWNCLMSTIYLTDYSFYHTHCQLLTTLNIPWPVNMIEATFILVLKHLYWWNINNLLSNWKLTKLIAMFYEED